MNGENGFKQIRVNGSDVLTFELSKSQDDIIYTVGVPKLLETVTQIYKAVPNAIAAINGPLFNFDGSSEGLFKWSKDLPTLVYTKDNKLVYMDASKMTPAQISAAEAGAKWCSGIGYPLLKDGIPFIKTIPIKDAKTGKITGYVADPYNCNPRTMIGQLKDGSIILVVVKGRVPLLQKGMTMDDQIKFMLSIGCVNAVNLDGGGSCDMVVDGKAKVGSKRAVGACFVVVRKPKIIVVPKPVVPAFTIIDHKLKIGSVSGVNNPVCTVIHHALSQKCTVEDIHQWHLDNGWAGIGYHYFINKLGQIYKGRADDIPGAHCKELDMNFKSIGICLEGCYEDYLVDVKDSSGKVISKKNIVDKEVPAIQYAALKWLVKDHLKMTVTYPHRKFATYKKCPGNYFPWDKFEKDVK